MYWKYCKHLERFTTNKKIMQQTTSILTKRYWQYMSDPLGTSVTVGGIFFGVLHIPFIITVDAISWILSIRIFK
jgi:hypothetical protein